MPTNIFSTYSTGENRITASVLAVLQSLSLNRIERLLGDLLGQSEFELVRFQNQPAKGGKGVPDALVLSSCRLLIETKVKRNSVEAKQLQNHLNRLQDAPESTRQLLVLTPDDRQPATFDQLDSQRLAWASFASLDQSIDELLKDSHEVVSEREAFLLRELQSMLRREKLIPTTADVVVVAARSAWQEYLDWNAYACQPNRTFQAVARIAFYSRGQIYPLVPRILETHESVEFVRGKRGKLGGLMEAMLDNSPRTEGQEFKVMLLSAQDSKDTIDLERPIENNLKTEAGRTWAFTLNQRYVPLKRLQQAQFTSELVDE